MAEYIYIDKNALYKKIAKLEELARDRYLDTPQNSPIYPRYMAQLNERTNLKQMIADFPAADVAPVKHGKWEQRDYFDEDDNVYVCSACDEPLILTAGSPEENNMYYCPNCGAKMDLKEAK